MLSVMWKVWLGTFLANYMKNNIMFMVNEGNDDKDDLKYPEKYNLENTQNIYFRSLDRRVDSDRLGAWFISPVGKIPRSDASSGTKDDSCHSTDASSCPDSLLNVPELSNADTVFILLHGNAKNR